MCASHGRGAAGGHLHPAVGEPPKPTNGQAGGLGEGVEEPSLISRSGHYGVMEQPEPAGSQVTVRVGAAAALTALSCVLVVAMWPMFGNAWWLAPFAFVPMYLVQYRLVPPRWSWLPVASVFGAYGFALAMLGSSVAGPEVILAGTLGVALVGALVGLPQRSFSERTGYRWFVWQLPVFWLAIELAIQENEVIGTYPWLAYRLSAVPDLAAPVSLTGTPFLSFLVLAINAAFALGLLMWMDTRWPALSAVPVSLRVGAGSLAVVGLLVATWAVAGMIINDRVRSDQGPTARVAYVQPGLGDTATGVLAGADGVDPRSSDERRDDQQIHLAELTRQAALEGAELVVWPEEVLDYDPRVNRTEWIPQLVSSTGVYLVAGFTEDFADPSQPNRSLLWAPSGEVLGVYAKTKRVVMEGESFPPGTEYPAFETSLGPLGMVICFDLDFPNGPVRKVTETGARIIAAPSIDFASAADIRTASTVFRALENRVGIVKADLAWDSAIISADGEVVTGTVIKDRTGGVAVEVADLPAGPGGAPFTRYGTLPLTVVALASVVLLIAAMWQVSLRSKAK